MVAQKKAKEPIHDEQFVKEHQFDEYTLQPDERTKEQVAETLQCSTRNIEILKKAGKLEAQKLRRRVDGIVRSQLIFKTADIEKYKKEIDAPVNLPKVEKMESGLQETKQSENQKFPSSSPDFANRFFNMMTQSMQTNLLPAKDEPPFLTVKEAAEFSHLSESCLRHLVNDGTLGKFTGTKGETMISRKQLLNL